MALPDVSPPGATLGSVRDFNSLYGSAAYDSIRQYFMSAFTPFPLLQAELDTLFYFSVANYAVGAFSRGATIKIPHLSFL